jgi:AcrR family transcriptional regulator
MSKAVAAGAVPASVPATGEPEAKPSQGPRYNDIILGSIEVFSRTNYEKATTALLAREAGVAEGTLYKYFSSKKDLFLECCRYVETLLLERYRDIYEETGNQPVEYLKKVAHSYLDFVKENPSMRRFLAFILNNAFDEDFRVELEGFIRLNVEATMNMIEKAKAQGALSSKVDARSASWMFVGGYFTLIMMTEIGADEALDHQYLENFLQSILNINVQE